MFQPESAKLSERICFCPNCIATETSCVIATGDRDSLQLVGGHVSVRLATTKMGQPASTLYDRAAVMEKYGVEPPQLIDVKALMGDASDNIPGVAGIGEKTALKLIGQYGDIETIYADLDAIDATKSVKAKLEAGKDAAFLSKTLATIDRNVPIELSLSDFIPQPMKEQETFELLSRLEMNSVIKKLGISGTYVPSENGKEAREIPTVHFVSKSISELMQQAGEAPVSFLIGWNKENDEKIDAIAVCAANEMILHHPQEGALYEQDLIELFSSQNPKYTFDSKSVYHWILSRGGELCNLTDDLLLSAYLLSANSSEYNIEGLCAGYHTGCKLDGVASMAGNITNELVSKLGKKNLSKGVRVTILEGVVTVDLSLNIEYGRNILETSKKVQEKVKSAIENMTGLEVADVNIHIASVDMENEKGK